MFEGKGKLVLKSGEVCSTLLLLFFFGLISDMANDAVHVLSSGI
jgi:hypothetical protein